VMTFYLRDHFPVDYRDQPGDEGSARPYASPNSETTKARNSAASMRAAAETSSLT
jgi:hypothetical protein